MKKIITILVSFFLMISISTNVFANTNNSLSQEEIKNVAIKFSEFSLSDFSDHSTDYLIDGEATELKQFLRDKRAIKTIKENKLGRMLSLIDFDIEDIKLTELNKSYDVKLTVKIKFLDGDVESSLKYFNSIIIDKESGLIVAASTNDLSAGTLLNNQIISSANDLVIFGKYENNDLALRNHSNDYSYVTEYKYDFDNCIKKFENYVEDVKNEDSIMNEKDNLTKFSKVNLLRNSFKRFSNSERRAMRQYQDKWADSFNPNYANFEDYGGDCTNYASQILYAGCKTMYKRSSSGIAGSNYWFYRSSNDRSSSWTGVNELRSFLLNNNTKGPSGSISSTFGALDSGDIIQLGNNGDFYHSIIVHTKGGDPTVTAHTENYSGYYSSRYGGASNSKIHIDGYYY